MEIVLARDMGFCWGVRRAIDMMEQAALEHGRIASIGPIVHNPHVVRDLEEKGVKIGITGSLPVAITAHGVGPEVLDEIRARGSEVIDTTCPIVTRSQRWARKMADAGFTVIVFGDPEHREVKGVLGWCGGRGIAVADGQALPKGTSSKIAIIAQTTQSPERFVAFVSRIMSERIGSISELRVINTLCDVTSNQQAAARELAREVDVMVVIGGRGSANTRHLLEVCQDEGTPAYHIEAAAELEGYWLSGCDRVGVTAGASTPDTTLLDVVERIRGLETSLTRLPREREALRP